MAGEVYRFLLRMPTHLRERLKDATEESGRSLNAEIVNRLEQSLADDPGVVRRLSLRISGAWMAAGERINRKGRSMSPNKNPRRTARRRRVAIGLAAVAAVVAAALGAGAVMLDGSSQTAAPAAETEHELSPALAQKLASAQRFSPAETQYEGGEEMGDGALEWQMHATPRTDIPLAAITGSRQDWKTLKSRGNSRAKLGDHGKWTNLGPDNAVYPLNPFRNRYVYVPNEYVAAGRTSHSVIDPNCGASTCRYWIANAGGGIWRTDNVFASQPKWEYVSAEFQHNNTAALELDPNDSTSNMIYAGTGEPNTCRSGCIAGVGLYKSKDGGDHWSGPIGAQYFSGRGIGSIQVKPGDSNTIFVGSGAQGSRGISSTCCTGVDRGANIPGAPHFGLYRSTDGGQTFSLVSQGNATNCTTNTPTEVFLGLTACSPRGARRVHIDPLNANTVYASFMAKGIWRSTSNGDPGSWVQIFAPRGPSTSPATGADVERAEFDVVALPNGKTRMYIGVGSGAGQTAKFFRSDDVASGTPTFTELTNSTSQGFCDPQCNYDSYVYVPRKADGTAHDPNTVYLLGDNEYNEAGLGASNGRAVLLSTDAGVSFTDMTYDATDNLQPHGIHPDQHSIVTNPADWKQFVETGDGGVVRSNGNFVDDSADCASVVVPSSNPATTAARLALCQAVTKRIPERIESINKGLNTLHFYQVTYNPNRPGELAGGAQDNGSWMRVPGTKTWVETFVADGAYNGFDAVDPNYSMFSWQGGSLAVLDEPRNQQAGTWISDTLLVLGAANFRYPREAAAFIAPTLFHPKVSKLMFTGREHVFRSLNGGINPAFPYAEVKEHCNVWTGNGDIDESGAYVPNIDVCDDWKAMGDPGHGGRLTYGPAALCPSPANPNPNQVWTVPCPAPYPWGTDRSGGHISVNEPSPSDKNVVWAATSGGRIFVTTNAAAADPSTIAWKRIDPSSSVDPPRYPTDIYIDPSNPYHVYISYSGYNHVTPDTPGHVFEVRYNPTTGAATFTRLDGSGPHAIGDLPVGTIERDEKKGRLYAGTDFGVIRRVNVRTGWTSVAPGLPTTTVPFLKIDQDNRVMYVTTHGFGAWTLKLS
ncbi:MAG TPA: Arc family DNA-binding protein [Gaiellaceae bacterium]|nr:Arc family DNA-binding protein [Gaiellaceae bacterium]